MGALPLWTREHISHFCSLFGLYNHHVVLEQAPPTVNDLSACQNAKCLSGFILVAKTLGTCNLLRVLRILCSQFPAPPLQRATVLGLVGTQNVCEISLSHGCRNVLKRCAEWCHPPILLELSKYSSQRARGSGTNSCTPPSCHEEFWKQLFCFLWHNSKTVSCHKTSLSLKLKPSGWALGETQPRVSPEVRVSRGPNVTF